MRPNPSLTRPDVPRLSRSILSRIEYSFSRMSHSLVVEGTVSINWMMWRPRLFRMEVLEDCQLIRSLVEVLCDIFSLVRISPSKHCVDMRW